MCGSNVKFRYPSWWLTGAVIILPVVYFISSKPSIGNCTSITSQEVRIFSTEPLVLYIQNFLSSVEIDHLMVIAEGHFQESRVWLDDVGYIDHDYRISESAELKNDDAVVQGIARRAMTLIGWRNNSTVLQPLKVQRYGEGGFYSYHYDWIDSDPRFPGNRMSTFMVYMKDNCTGGGTNFPFLLPPANKAWCRFIVCEGDEDEDYPGVTFKPRKGAAIFWENFASNGTPHLSTRHASLPVRSGEKVGLNIWSWDHSWRNMSTESLR